MYQRFLEQFTDFIFVEHDLLPSDILFLPGNTFPQMAEEAARLWKTGLAPLILPSGCHALLEKDFQGVTDRTGKYPGTFSTEWEFLKMVLLANGVSETSILKEDTASYTYENAIYSRKVTDCLGLRIHRAIICCHAFHARRCLLYYQLLFPETSLLIHPVDTGINRENWHQTEQGIDTVLGEIERCGGQFHKILRDL